MTLRGPSRPASARESASLRRVRRLIILALAAFVLLFLWKAPPWLVVVLAALAGQAATLLLR